MLRQGDHALALETATGTIEVLLAIDADGTPAAVNGYVEASGEDIRGAVNR